MTEIVKGRSPFYPGQPVPADFFIGRAAEIQRIMTRGVGQVSEGKPVAMYVQGEYGIGKSSIANFVQWIAEKNYGLHGIYAPLGGCRNLDDVSETVLKATLRSGALEPGRAEKLKNWLAKYVGKQELFGLTLNFEALKKDAPALSTPLGMLEFLKETRGELKDTGVKGIFLILDEINGLTSDPAFANLIKGLVDTNALDRQPLPLLLMLCGVEEKRREMIQKHQPVDRIFDVIEIGVMTKQEMEDFFTKAFQSAQMVVEDAAMHVLTHYSAGFPKIMHLIGDAAYWLDGDGRVDKKDAFEAVVTAAEDVGKKYVEQQVYKALRSPVYHSILDKIAKTSPYSMSFLKASISSGLTETEKRKFSNFLRKMKELKVLRSGDVAGEYIFNMRMVRLYIWLQSPRKESPSS